MGNDSPPGKMPNAKIAAAVAKSIEARATISSRPSDPISPDSGSSRATAATVAVKRMAKIQTSKPLAPPETNASGYNATAVQAYRDPATRRTPSTRVNDPAAAIQITPCPSDGEVMLAAVSASTKPTCRASKMIEWIKIANAIGIHIQTKLVGPMSARTMKENAASGAKMAKPSEFSALKPPPALNKTATETKIAK